MNGELAVLDVLRTTAGVTALIGSGTSARVYPLDIPEGATFPAIVLALNDLGPHDSKSGVSLADKDIVTVQCIVESLDKQANYKNLKALGDAVRAALDHKSGTYNGIVIDNIRITNEDTFNDTYTNKKVFIQEQTYEVCVKR